MTLTLTSTSFTEGGIIPRAHTCEGADQSPHLAWTGLPEGTAALALIVDDPDAPDPSAPRTVWAHWLLYNIPPFLSELAAGINPADLPQDTRHGLNDWGQTGYRGPCPPIGRHRYYFKLFALDDALEYLGTPRKADLEQAVAGHVLAQAQLMGTYQKGDR
jgi:Raf kinase inhibitor-like YbhB/YbcL family protein